MVPALPYVCGSLSPNETSFITHVGVRAAPPLDQRPLYGPRIGPHEHANFLWQVNAFP